MIVLWALGPPVVGWLLYMLRRHLLKVVVFFAALPAFLMKPVPPIDRFFWFVAVCALVTTISYFMIPSHIPRTKHAQAAATA